MLITSEESAFTFFGAASKETSSLNILWYARRGFILFKNIISIGRIQNLRKVGILWDISSVLMHESWKKKSLNMAMRKGRLNYSSFWKEKVIEGPFLSVHEWKLHWMGSAYFSVWSIHSCKKKKKKTASKVQPN